MHYKRSEQDLIDEYIAESGIPNRYMLIEREDYQISGEVEKQALNYVDELLDNYKKLTGIIMIGKPGNGKTMLSSVLLKEFIRKYKKPSLFVEAIVFFRELKGTYRNHGHTEEEIMLKYSRIPLLVMDELGMQYNSTTEQIYLMELINNRYNNQLPTILIGNVTIPEIKQIIGEKGLDRIRHNGRLLQFTGESRRK